MKKLNNKGFALAEILVVTVFVMIIFSIIYTNFYPIMAEYERRESYDDVDGKYAAYWFKKIVEKNNFISTYKTVIDTNYKKLECNDLTLEKELCINLVKEYGVINAYISKYDNINFKAFVNSNPSSFSSGFKEYVAYLPDYSGKSGYRIIVEFHRTKAENDYYAYATMEVSE